jgi:hypothetical protein
MKGKKGLVSCFRCEKHSERKEKACVGDGSLLLAAMACFCESFAGKHAELCLVDDLFKKYSG